MSNEAAITRPAWCDFDRRRTIVALFVILLVYAFLLRIFSLDSKVNVDAIWMWHGHTLRFWRGLSTGRWMDTFQHHPGVTFMWLSGLSMKIFGVFGKPLSDPVLVAGKIPVVLISSLAVGFTFLWSRRILGSSFTPWAALAAFLLASEPFVVGHSRTFHLDMLVTSFGWCASLAACVAALERKRRWALLTGALLGLAILSKVSASAIALGIALLFMLSIIRAQQWADRKRLAACLGIIVLVSVLVVVLLWPALLLAPAKSATLFMARVKQEFAAGHQLFAWGAISRKDPGATFYLAVFLFRTTPEVMLLTLIAIVGAFRLGFRKDELSLTAKGSYAGGAIVLTHIVWLLVFLTNQKKQDRYLLTFFPLICLIAVFALQRIYAAQRVQRLLARLGRRASVMLLVLAALLVAGRTARVIAAYPVPMGWTSTLPFLNAERAVQLGIGEGLKEVALFIKKDTPRGKIPTLSLYVYHRALAPWLRYRPVHHSKSTYIIDYICLRQRKVEAKLIRQYTRGIKPLLVVRYGNIIYARVYPGPKHRSRTARR